jgi:diguanylate cyclase (GGDEF)-like protein
VSTGSFHSEGVHGHMPGDNARAPADANGTVRLVVVGRTTVDDRLAGEAGVEVVRVASVLEAIGEVSLPSDALSQSTANAKRVTVVLTRSALIEGPGEELAEAIRIADPEAKVVCEGGIATNGKAAWWDATFDDHDADEAVRAILSAGIESEPAPAEPSDPRADDKVDEPAVPMITGRPTITRRPTRRTETLDDDMPADDADLRDAPLIGTEPTAGYTPVSRTSGVASPDSDSDAVAGAWAVGDRTLVGAVIRGVDPLPMAMDLLRERTGRRDVDFLPLSGDEPEFDDTSALGVPVAWEGRPLGTLIANDADRATLAKLTPHAAWLAGWIRLSQQSKGLRKAAFTDPLTGAWNRRYFERYLDTSITRAREDRLSLTVLMFDIDGFKQYNDRYGHPAGDEILIETVRVLKSVIRPSDRVCRIGGDEFAVIFFEPTGPRSPSSRPPESVYVLTKRVQQKIREREFPKLGREAAGRLTISGGLATYPWDGADATSLLERADELAIQSKRAGKNAIALGPGAERLCAGDLDAE